MRIKVANVGEFFIRQNGVTQAQAMRLLGRRVEHVALGTDEALERHDDFFADRVDRRIGHLRK